jgi:plasmid stability protein
MLATCSHALHMSKMIQIRNVPEELHRRLKTRAAAAGKTLSDYLLDELKRSAENPTIDELWQRIRAHGPVHLKESAADSIRAEREARERDLEP